MARKPTATSRATRPQGTIVQVGLLGGPAATINLGLLLVKRLRWIGTVMRSRPIEEKIAISQRFAAEVLPLFTSGALRPVIDRRFSDSTTSPRPTASWRPTPTSAS